MPEYNYPRTRPSQAQNAASTGCGSSDSADQVGQMVGGFFRGFLGTSTSATTGQSETASGGFPSGYELWGDINHAANLLEGHLLVVHLATNRCYVVDPKNGSITFLFSLHWGPRTFMWRAIADNDGTIYCSVSGTVASIDGAIPPVYAPPAAKFGYWGAVVRIRHKEGIIQPIVETPAPGQGDVVDPHGMQNLDKNSLLVCDFDDFGGGGSVYKVEKRTGTVDVLSRSKTFDTPVSAYQDSDGILWVASADMSEQNDGEIIRIAPDGSETIALPRGGRDSGQVVGVLPANDPSKLVVFRCEWPNLKGRSAVMLLDKNSGHTETLFQSTVEEPAFYNTNGDVAGDMLWFGESVKKEIVGYDLAAKSVVTRIDLLGIAGGCWGMTDSYDGIESVTVIPEQVPYEP